MRTGKADVRVSGKNHVSFIRSGGKGAQETNALGGNKKGLGYFLFFGNCTSKLTHMQAAAAAAERLKERRTKKRRGRMTSCTAEIVASKS